MRRVLLFVSEVLSLLALIWLAIYRWPFRLKIRWDEQDKSWIIDARFLDRPIYKHAKTAKGIAEEICLVAGELHPFWRVRLIGYLGSWLRANQGLSNEVHEGVKICYIHLRQEAQFNIGYY